MIVWGGNFSGAGGPAGGGSYDPTANSWTYIAEATITNPRQNHTAVWTGSEMIVWGGTLPDQTGANDGARYNPVSDSWTLTGNDGAPLSRQQHNAVWTGNEMLIFGGYGELANYPYNDISAYYPGRVLFLYQRP